MPLRCKQTPVLLTKCALVIPGANREAAVTAELRRRSATRARAPRKMYARLRLTVA